MALFKERGFDQTTMRDVSQAAGMALGTAYYHFPSKEAIIAEYYQTVQYQHHAYVVEHLPGVKSLQDRLRLVFRSKIDILQADRKLIGVIFRYTGDPLHPLSLLGEGTRDLQQQTAETIGLALKGERFSREVAELLPMALWSLHMGTLLYLLYDTSERQTRTYALVDQSLALTTQLLGVVRQPLLSPVVLPILRQVSGLLDAAQINLIPPKPQG